MARSTHSSKKQFTLDNVLRAIQKGKPGDSLKVAGIFKPYLKGKRIDVKKAIAEHVRARDERSKRSQSSM